jgi:preprotein translocase subunit SecD
MPGLHQFKKAGLSGLFLCALAIAGSAQAAPLTIEITAAEAAYDQRSNEPLVSFRMSAKSQAAFADFTSANVGRKMEMRVDGALMSAPVIREPIRGGTGQIAGGLTAQQARDMAKALAAGTARLEVELAD